MPRFIHHKLLKTNHKYLKSSKRETPAQLIDEGTILMTVDYCQKSQKPEENGTILSSAKQKNHQLRILPPVKTSFRDEG